MAVVTRRSILRAAPLAALSARSAEGKLSVAFITEPGGTHLDLMVKGVAKCTDVGSVAIADVSSESFERVRRLLDGSGHSLRTFTSPAEMLKSAKPDLTVVTVEARHNPNLCAQAIDAGSHVLCEKPPCVRPGDFESLAKKAKAQNRTLMLAMATRSNLAVAQAKQLIERGWLGKPYGVAMTWIGDHTRLTTPEWQKMWVSHKDRAGGGKLAFHGIHYLDLIHHLTGDPIAKVSALCRNVGGEPINVEDAAVLALQFRSGATGTLNTGYYLDKGNSNVIQIWGEKGRIRFDPFAPLRWYSSHTDAPKGEQTAEYAGTDADYDTMMAQAVRGVSGGPAFMTTDESLHVVRVIFAGYRASETGQSQSVPA